VRCLPPNSEFRIYVNKKIKEKIKKEKKKEKKNKCSAVPSAKL